MASQTTTVADASLLGAAVGVATPRQPPNPLPSSSLLSKLFFSWVSPYLRAKGDLTEADMWELLPSDSTAELCSRLSTEWAKTVADGKPSLGRAMCRAFSGGYLLSNISLWLKTAFAIGLTQFLGALLTTLNDPVAIATDAGVRAAYLYGLGLVLCAVASALLHHLYYFAAWRYGMRFRAAFTALIFDKALKVRLDALAGVSTGHVVNLASADIGTFQKLGTYSAYLLVVPIETAVIFWLLWRQVAVSTLGGLAVLLVMTALMAGFSAIFGRLRHATALATDERVRLTSQIISGMRTLKLMGWEAPFARAVAGVRGREMGLVRRTAYLRGVNEGLFVVTSIIVAAAVFLIFTRGADAQTLTPSNLWVTMSLFGLLQLEAAKFLPLALEALSESSISLGRLQRFLLLPEAQGGSHLLEGPAATSASASSAGAGGVNAKLAVHETGNPLVAATAAAALPSIVAQGLPTLEVGLLNSAHTAPSLVVSGLTCSWLPVGSKAAIPASASGKGVASQPAGNASASAASAASASGVVNSSGTAGATRTVLSDVSFTAQAGALTMVVGPVSSGKTSLLMALLGELPASAGAVTISHASGVRAAAEGVEASASPAHALPVQQPPRIAYVSQVPWIVSGTVRDNITMGLPFDAPLYAAVLDGCCLLPDIAGFPRGDLEHIGERGVSLSGGQRARLSLARACYQRADIYLIDDCLAAVDARVGRRLFRRCIGGGLLAGKTRILVLHQLQFLPSADAIVVLSAGRVLTQGSFADLSRAMSAERAAANAASAASGGTTATDERAAGSGPGLGQALTEILLADRTGHVSPSWQHTPRSRGAGSGSGAVAVGARGSRTGSAAAGFSAGELPELTLLEAAAGVADADDAPDADADDDNEGASAAKAGTLVVPTAVANSGGIAAAAVPVPGLRAAESVGAAEEPAVPGGSLAIAAAVAAREPKALVMMQRLQSHGAMHAASEGEHHSHAADAADGAAMSEVPVAAGAGALQVPASADAAGVSGGVGALPLSPTSVTRVASFFGRRTGNATEESSAPLSTLLSSSASASHAASPAQASPASSSAPASAPDAASASSASASASSTDAASAAAPGQAASGADAAPDAGAPIAASSASDAPAQAEPNANNEIAAAGSTALAHPGGAAAPAAPAAPVSAPAPGPGPGPGPGPAPCPGPGIITAETVGSGSVPWRVYAGYISAAGGACEAIYIAILLFGGAALFTYSSVWLSVWSAASPADQLAPRYAIIFGALCAASLLISIWRAVACFGVCVLAARQLHDASFSHVLRAPLLFFDSNPAGRIINRFSKDLSVVDDAMPALVFDFLASLAAVSAVRAGSCRAVRNEPCWRLCRGVRLALLPSYCRRTMHCIPVHYAMPQIATRICFQCAGAGHAGHCLCHQPVHPHLTATAGACTCTNICVACMAMLLLLFGASLKHLPPRCHCCRALCAWPPTRPPSPSPRPRCTAVAGLLPAAALLHGDGPRPQAPRRGVPLADLLPAVRVPDGPARPARPAPAAAAARALCRRCGRQQPSVLLLPRRITLVGRPSRCHLPRPRHRDDLRCHRAAHVPAPSAGWSVHQPDGSPCLGLPVDFPPVHRAEQQHDERAARARVRRAAHRGCGCRRRHHLWLCAWRGRRCPRPCVCLFWPVEGCECTSNDAACDLAQRRRRDFL